jgi:sortase (surface protein transpeptidase)
MTWPENGISAPPGRPPAGTHRAWFAGVFGLFLLFSGAITITIAMLTQNHAPQPTAAAAGVTGTKHGPSIRRSTPVAINIPAIGVHSKLLHLGLNTDDTIAVPPLKTSAGVAAWYEYSATPGQIGASVIEGHVDSKSGPAIFFRLGALRPGDTIDVALADGITAVFKVSGVREYRKDNFPDRLVYGKTNYAALRLITCGGAFDYATGHYLSSTVVYATLTGHQASGRSGSAGDPGSEA